jgi:regulator of protease activity HflC (stomatin/prohibitin superfamily)
MRRRLLRASLNLPHDQLRAPRKVLQPVDLPQEEIISRENQDLDMTTPVAATVVDMVGTVEEVTAVDVIMV